VLLGFYYRTLTNVYRILSIRFQHNLKVFTQGQTGQQTTAKPLKYRVCCHMNSKTRSGEILKLPIQIMKFPVHFPPIISRANTISVSFNESDSWNTNFSPQLHVKNMRYMSRTTCMSKKIQRLISWSGPRLPIPRLCRFSLAGLPMSHII
jgi:hypothetical protein